MNDERNQYTTERGVTIQVVPIPLLLDEIRRANPLPALPTYTEKLAGGATDEITITPETAEAWATGDPETWAQYAETWAEYERAHEAAQSVLNERIREAAIRRAVIVELPEDEAWIQEQRELGLTVPADPRARRLHYIRTEVIGGIRDLLKITAMASGSDMSEEALSAAEASFRSSLARTLLRGLTAQEGGAVDAGESGGADTSGESVGDET